MTQTPRLRLAARNDQHKHRAFDSVREDLTQGIFMRVASCLNKLTERGDVIAFKTNTMSN